MNPLVDLTKLTDQQLEDKIQELSRKYFMPMSGELKFQIIQMIDLHKMALQERRMRTYEEQFKKNSDKGLDNLISIN